MLPNNAPPDRRDYRITVQTPEFRLAETNGQTIIDGYAAVFRVRSEDLGGFVEEIQPGFFSNVLRNDVRALFNHDRNFVLGRTLSGTLALSEDETGLFTHCEAPDSATIRDLVISPMRRRDITQMSFSFYVNEGGDFWHLEGDQVVRTLLPGGCGELFDIAYVTYAAYPQTSAYVRSLAQNFREQQGAPGSQQAPDDAQAKAAILQQQAARGRYLDLLQRTNF